MFYINYYVVTLVPLCSIIVVHYLLFVLRANGVFFFCLLMAKVFF